MISPEKRDANRRNAQKSTGPKSPEGKARSSRNAVTHGLTASPGDHTEEYRRVLAEWIDDLKPKGIVERTLAERACRAAWNLRRCDRYEDATAAMRDRDAAESHELAEAARVEALGRRLIAMPVRDESENASPSKPIAPPGGGDEDPAALLAELRRTAAGVSWLLARWAELERSLKAPGGWDAARWSVAIRLLGMTSESAADHPTIGRIMPRAVAPSSSGSWFDHPAMKGALEAAIEAGERGLGDPKQLWLECLNAVARRERGEGESGSADTKRIATLIRSERAKLARLMRGVLKANAAEDRAGAADRAMFDESKSLSLCLRYATDASRDFHRSITDLTKLRESGGGEGRDDGDEGPEPPPPSSPPESDGGDDVVGDDPVEIAASGDSGILRNEPTEVPAESARGLLKQPDRTGWRTLRSPDLTSHRKSFGCHAYVLVSVFPVIPRDAKTRLRVCDLFPVVPRDAKTRLRVRKRGTQDPVSRDRAGGEKRTSVAFSRNVLRWIVAFPKRASYLEERELLACVTSRFWSRLEDCTDETRKSLEPRFGEKSLKSRTCLAERRVADS